MPMYERVANIITKYNRLLISRGQWNGAALSQRRVYIVLYLWSTSCAISQNESIYIQSAKLLADRFDVWGKRNRNVPWQIVFLHHTAQIYDQWKTGRSLNSSNQISRDAIKENLRVQILKTNPSAFCRYSRSRRQYSFLLKNMHSPSKKYIYNKVCDRSEAGGAGFEFGVLIKYQNREGMRGGQQQRGELGRWPDVPAFRSASTPTGWSGNPQVVLLFQLILSTCFLLWKCERAALGVLYAGSKFPYWLMTNVHTPPTWQP